MKNTIESTSTRVLLFVIILVTLTVLAWKTCSVDDDESRYLNNDIYWTSLK